MTRLFVSLGIVFIVCTSSALAQDINSPDVDIFDSVSGAYDRLEERGEVITDEPDTTPDVIVEPVDINDLRDSDRDLIDSAERPFGNPENYPSAEEPLPDYEPSEVGSDYN